jgi:hypothetical protein
MKFVQVISLSSSDSLGQARVPPDFPLPRLVQAAAMLALRGACLLSSTEAELLGEIDVIPSWS